MKKCLTAEEGAGEEGEEEAKVAQFPKQQDFEEILITTSRFQSYWTEVGEVWMKR